MRGSVGYLARIALPPEAIVRVAIVDVSRAGATPADAGATVAEYVVSPPGQPPVPFSVEIDTASIPAGARLVLRARIEVGDRDWFVSDVDHPLVLDDDGSHVLVLGRAPL